jgi:hypothetical protein
LIIPGIFSSFPSVHEQVLDSKTFLAAMFAIEILLDNPLPFSVFGLFLYSFLHLTPSKPPNILGFPGTCRVLGGLGFIR